MFENRLACRRRAAALRQRRPVDCQTNMSVHLVTVFEMYSSSSSVVVVAFASVASATFAVVVATAFVVVVAFALVVAFAFAAFVSVRQWKTSQCDNWRAPVRRRDIATSYRIVF